MNAVQSIHKRLYASGKGWIIGKLILVLTHTGRKSGTRYGTPLQYEKIDGAYYVGAGRGCKADWFRNIQADPHVHVQVNRREFDGLAQAVTDPLRVADFLEYRLKRHPLMIGLIMKLTHHLPMRPSRAQLLELAKTTALVILRPLPPSQTMTSEFLSNPKNHPILWLRVSYWAGAVLDLLAGLTMLFPALFAVNNRLSSFYPAPDYRYAMGMGAPLMLAWTVLLLWADRKPLERKGLLPITLLVVVGEVINEIVAARTGYISVGALIPTWIVQALLAGLFLFAWWNARDGKAK